MKYKLLKDLPNLEKGEIFYEYHGFYVSDNSTYKFAFELICDGDWFEEIKEIEYPLSWRAEYEGVYYVCNYMYDYVTSMKNANTKQDDNFFISGNYYQKIEQAKKAIEKQKAYMEYIRLVEKLNEGWKPDFLSDKNRAYHISYNHAEESLGLGYSLDTTIQRRPVNEYFKSNELLDNLIEQLGEDKIKLALGF